MKIYTSVLTVCYSDDIGITKIMVDDEGISFSNGYCYFSDGAKDYKIPMENIKYIYTEV